MFLEHSEELLDKGWHGEPIPVARSPGESEGVCVLGVRPWEGPGTQGTALSEMSTELRDWRQQGTEMDILADHRPPEQLWMNKDFGIQRAQQSRQPPVKGPSERPS